MGGTMSRNKGKRAERQVIELLQPIIDYAYHEFELDPPTLQRNTLQSDTGGCDLAGLEWLALEVKHQETSQLNQWWEQTYRQSRGRNGKHKVPVLFYKSNNVAFRVRMESLLLAEDRTHPCIVDISTEDFGWWFYYRLTAELAKGEV